MIPGVQGPVYLDRLSICKSELGPGRDVRVGDEVFHGFDGPSFSWMASFSRCSYASWNAIIAYLVLEMSTSLVHSNSRMDPNLDLSNRHR